MHLRKINNSDTNLQVPLQYDTDLIDVEITSKGINIEGGLLTWEQINKAREVLNMISFTDEEFEKWAMENGYVKASELSNPKVLNGYAFMDARNDAVAIVLKAMQVGMPNEHFDKLLRIQTWLKQEVEEFLKDKNIDMKIRTINE